jgi:hypothetical protein
MAMKIERGRSRRGSPIVYLRSVVTVDNGTLCNPVPGKKAVRADELV